MIAKILDFGISKFMDKSPSKQTPMDLVLGTLLYMSPEQWRASALVDAKADIWSLGAALYEMLTGRPPFVAETIPALLGMIMEDAPPALAGIDPAFAALVFRCLEKDPSKRPASMRELCTSLEPFTTAPTIIVDSTGEEGPRSIGAALNAAFDGSLIKIRPGVYRENITVATNVQLVSDGPEGSVIIEPSALAPCIVVMCAAPVLRGLTIRVETAGAPSAILIDGGAPQFEHCKLNTGGRAYALRIHNGAKPHLTVCDLQGTVGINGAGGTFHACVLHNADGAAVVLERGADPTFTDCELRANGVGIRACDAGRGTFERCDIHGNRIGVEVVRDANPRIVRCTIRDGKYGIRVDSLGCGTFESCDISGNGFVGVDVQLEGNPTLSLCAIHDNKCEGVFVHKKGGGTFERCDIYDNASAGAIVATQSSPVFVGCAIHDAKPRGGSIMRENLRHAVLEMRTVEIGSISEFVDSTGMGVMVTTEATPTFTDCDIYSNSSAGVLVTSQGAPRFSSCKIRDGKDRGIAVSKGARGSFANCDICENAHAGVFVSTESDPIFEGCTLHHGKQEGAVVEENGYGIFKSCDIHSNAFVGIAVRTSGNPKVLGCQIHDGKGAGVSVHTDGRGIFENCDIFANATAGVEVAANGSPKLVDCKVRDGQDAGVRVYTDGRGTFENCDVFANAKAGIDVAEMATPPLLVVRSTTAKMPASMSTPMVKASSRTAISLPMRVLALRSWRAGPLSLLVA
jgi:F-box protein 11